ncbi:MAG: hypothetical protein CO186_10605 [Zetaproteobacteria bacterium CG_4_9_14_3_um_filter_49_83]|nr:MAG: hypothetical protein AUJ56_09425 [Zetaproteobacteria bacterium CG1_02_49_23]PIQ30675.1 MAG: hypothetical protein COW62_11560 [Zetaproteobacteria bacterium CG17_big_fil_post_rev_8_21_14_2_50_50_13]PIY57165.1 MAG: hypothetical protein COZ00_00240 [Zetaproteobacteria bacterium CG_4_10_14_0_8_um_filter_49_80]PJA34440.1 MAG: hypothetical protein CO186_10605 [Zetaproteobacteria bacterium CG_4_9_14_3_um_filter_49_83]
MANGQSLIIQSTRIQGSIVQLCGERVMLENDPAALYGVETKALTRDDRRPQGEKIAYRLCVSTR